MNTIAKGDFTFVQNGDFYLYQSAFSDFMQTDHNGFFLSLALREVVANMTHGLWAKIRHKKKLIICTQKPKIVTLGFLQRHIVDQN